MRLDSGLYRRLLACGVAVAAGLAVAGCTDQSAPVAYVNGNAISQDDYVSLLEMSQSRGTLAGQTTLNSMIQNQLLVDEARKEGVAPSREELQAALNQLRLNPQFQETMRQTGLSEGQIMRLFLEPQICQVRLMAKMAGVTDADIRSTFTAHKADLRQPEQVMVRVLQLPDRKRAADALKLVGKTSFESIAQTFGGTGAGPVVALRRGGINPYPPTVVDAAFATPKGKTTGIIEAAPQANPLQPQAAPASAKQYYIVDVEDHIPAQEPDLNNPLIRNPVTAIAAQQKGMGKLSPTALQDMVASLRRTADISVVRPSLKAVEKAPPPPAIPGVGGPG